ITRTVALLAIALLSPSLAPAQSAYPPASHLAGQWWQWILETPSSVNPLLDPTGQFGAINQPKGNVRFLAVNTGRATMGTVNGRAGKALFFPIVNTFDVEHGVATGIGAAGGKVLSVKNPLQTAQDLVSAIMATAYGFSCSVDGTPVPIPSANLEQSNPFP